jgi:hypothetical protein
LPATAVATAPSRPPRAVVLTVVDVPSVGSVLVAETLLDVELFVDVDTDVDTDVCVEVDVDECVEFDVELEPVGWLVGVDVQAALE